NFIAGGAGRLIRQAVVIDVIFGCSGLQKMADDGSMGIVVTEYKPSDISDVKVVGKTIACAVMVKLAEFNQDCAVPAVCQNPFLVVVEVAIPYCQIVAFRSNTSAV